MKQVKMSQYYLALYLVRYKSGLLGEKILKNEKGPTSIQKIEI
jgi:hypothetical protein